jgi:uncharacterized protein
MEIARNAPPDRQIVQKYRSGGFTVAGTRHDGPVIVMPKATVAWTAGQVAEIDGPALAATLRDSGIALCLIGCGVRMEPLPREVRAALKSAGIAVDTMATGAACRTYNVLVAEGRAVAAALIPL